MCLIDFSDAIFLAKRLMPSIDESLTDLVDMPILRLLRSVARSTPEPEPDMDGWV